MGTGMREQAHDILRCRGAIAPLVRPVNRRVFFKNRVVAHAVRSFIILFIGDSSITYNSMNVDSSRWSLFLNF